MQHCDPEDLALLALGEDVPVDAEHLSACADCQAELESLRSVVTGARTGRVTQVTPPPSVWAGIAAATGVASAPTVPSAPTARRAVPASPARRWPTWALVAAAVAGLLAGGGVVAALGGQGEDGAPTQVVVAARLEPLVASAGAGEADLVESDGGLVLRLDARSLPADSDGFYEVWLLDEAAERMVPLGVLVGGSGEFAVPPELDLGEYPVVDVSVEPLDGDPTHSGNSLLRGSLGPLGT